MSFDFHQCSTIGHMLFLIVVWCGAVLPATSSDSVIKAAITLTPIILILIVSYVGAATADSADDAVRQRDALREGCISVADLESGLGTGSVFCEECQLRVSPKSKHCFRCRKCTASYIYHSSIINNCVNGKNYAWYSIFLVSAIVMCCVMVLQSATVLQNHQDNATTSGQRLLCQKLTDGQRLRRCEAAHAATMILFSMTAAVTAVMFACGTIYHKRKVMEKCCDSMWYALRKGSKVGAVAATPNIMPAGNASPLPPDMSVSGGSSMKCDIDDPTKSDSGHYRKDTNRISNYNTHGCNNKTNFVNIHNNHGAGDEYRHREIPHFSQVRHSRFHAISRVIRCRSVDVENTTPVITLVGYASPTLPDKGTSGEPAAVDLESITPYFSPPGSVPSTSWDKGNRDELVMMDMESITPDLILARNAASLSRRQRKRPDSTQKGTSDELVVVELESTSPDFSPAARSPSFSPAARSPSFSPDMSVSGGSLLKCGVNRNRGNSYGRNHDDSDSTRHNNIDSLVPPDLPADLYQSDYYCDFHQRVLSSLEAQFLSGPQTCSRSSMRTVCPTSWYIPSYGLVSHSINTPQ